tara:strand:- start:92 stop:814 length:723 start_codon:yes stop_codon:yes gene_type:complete
MNKTYLESFIGKYHLGGLISNVVWKARNNKLTTTFTTEGKEMLGSVSFDNFKYPDADLGVFDTERLIRMLSVLNGNCDLSYQNIEDKIIAITLKDGNAEVKFNLGDLSIFPEETKLKNEPAYNLTLKMNTESAKAFVNGCNAITESNHFTVVGDDSSCELIVNFDKTKNLDMVRVPVQVVEGGEVENISFSSLHLKSIINANAGADISLKVSNQGLLKCMFTTKEYSSVYYLVAMDKNNG